MGQVLAICVSKKKGEQKKPVDSAVLIEEHGIEGDAHAGSGRQVSLLAVESVDKMRHKLPTLKAGDFAENLLVSGFPITFLRVGLQFTIGSTLLELMQIGKKCHSKCEIHKAVGFCVMPTEGIFARVLKGGEIKTGDEITLLP